MTLDIGAIKLRWYDEFVSIEDTRTDIKALLDEVERLQALVEQDIAASFGAEHDIPKETKR